MQFLVVVLLGFCVSAAWSQDFVCGYVPPEDGSSLQGPSGQSSSYTGDTVRKLILFGKFSGGSAPPDLTADVFRDRDGNLTKSATDLLDIEDDGSLPHFLYKMS